MGNDASNADAEPLNPSHQAIVDLVQRAKDTNVVRFEGADYEVLQADYVPHTKLLLSEALVLAQSLIAEFDESSRSHELPEYAAFDESIEDIELSEFNINDRDFNLTVDEFLQPHESNNRRQAIADLAFIVHAELKQKLPRLQRVGGVKESWRILAECDHVLRRIRKSFTALENSVAQAAACPPALDFYSELQQSLAIRCCYRKFWRNLIVVKTSDLTEVRKALRDMGTRIAMLIGHPIYVDLRIEDRLQLRALQARILAWLKGEGDSSFELGIRIRQDFLGFAQMLRQVSLREEVATYDRKIISQLRALLEVSQDNNLLSVAEYSCLSLLEGMHDKLDQVIDAGPTQMRAPVLRLLESLDTAS